MDGFASPWKRPKRRRLPVGLSSRTLSDTLMNLKQLYRRRLCLGVTLCNFIRKRHQGGGKKMSI